ncbi:hypothetical protein GCM10027051_34810 [Niabella terrae]
MEQPIIELKGLTKQYKTLKAVDDLNLNIQKGEIFGLLGPNGAGKTTTILMMLGLTDPSAGTAYVCGYNATKNPISVKRKVGYMPDSVGFYDGMTALENLMYIGRLNRIPEQELQSRAREMLLQVGLSEVLHKKAATFSRGMKQRLGLAEVLIKNPEVIILDEPTLGIDPSGVREFLSLIRQLSRQQGLTVLLSSHHLHHVQQVCDRVGIFVKGKLLVEGNINTLSRNLFQKDGVVTTIRFASPLPRPWEPESRLQDWEEIRELTLTENEVTFGCSQDITARLVRFLVENQMEITGVHRKEYGLDDIYQKYFENNSTENPVHEKSGSFIQRSFKKFSKEK